MADEDKRVAVRLEGLNEHYNKAQQQSAKETRALAGAGEESFKKLSSSADRELGKTVKRSQDVGESISKISAGAAIAGAGILAMGLKFSGEFTDIGREVLKVQRYTGMTAEAASVLRYQAQATGVDTDKLTKSLGFLAKGMQTAPDKFEELGISVRDSRGQLRNTNDVLLEVVDKITATTNATERLAIAQSIFGRSGADLLPFLMRGRDGLAELAAEAEKYGLVLNDQNLVAVKESVKAHREFDAAVQGLKMRIGQEFLPIATTATELMADLAAGAHGAAGEWLVYAAAGLIAVGSMAGTINEAVILTRSVGAATTGVRAFAAAQIAAAGGAASVAAGAAVTAGAIALVGYHYKQTADAASKPIQSGVDAAKTKMMGESYEELAAHIGRVKDVADDVGDDWNPMVRSAEGDIRKLQEYGQHQLGLADAVVAASGAGADTALRWVQRQAALGVEYSSTSDAVAAFTGKVDVANLSAEDAADALKAQQDALKQLNDELRASVDPLFAMQRATRGNADAQLKVEDAQREAFFAQNHYNALVKAYGKDSLVAQDAARGLADRQRELTDANTAAATSALDVSTAANTLQFAIDNGTVSVGAAKGQLELWVAQGLLTREQADSVATGFTNAAIQADILNTKDARPGVHPQGLDEALTKLREMRELVDGFFGPSAADLYARGIGVKPGTAPPRVGSVSLDGQQVYGLDGQWHSRSGIPGMASGGYPAPGQLVRVNELGTEMLTQGGKDYLMMGAQGGKITPAGRFMVAGGSSSSTTTNNNIVVQTNDVDRGVRSAMREMRKQAIFAGGR
jgi:hypothetical protein